MRVSKPQVVPAPITIHGDSRTTEQLVGDLEAHYAINDVVPQMLRHEQFVVINDVEYCLGVICGWEFEDHLRTTENIWTKADSRGWLHPPAFVVGPVREQVSDEQILAMGLSDLVVGSEPIVVGGEPRLLSASRRGDGNRLRSYLARPKNVWLRNDGFLFLVPSPPSP